MGASPPGPPKGFLWADDARELSVIDSWARNVTGEPLEPGGR